MKALLLIFCSKAGGERVFEPGPRLEARLDACLRGEAGMALEQHGLLGHGVFCPAS